jgi:hypothetical protein
VLAVISDLSFDSTDHAGIPLITLVVEVFGSATGYDDSSRNRDSFDHSLERSFVGALVVFKSHGDLLRSMRSGCNPGRAHLNPKDDRALPNPTTRSDNDSSDRPDGLRLRYTA